MGGGIGKIEMLKKTNILGLVGGGKNPRFPLNNLIIWDDHQGRIISQIRFNKDVLNVRLRAEKIISICEDKIYSFNLNTLETENIFETFENTLGIIGISNGDNNKLIIAFPFQFQGSVCIINIMNQKNTKPKRINAHESKIQCLSINKEGSLLATSSDKGTLIKIFSLPNGESVMELRRGTKNVEMTCISFDPNNKFIGCTSDVGTIHIFSIASITKNLTNDNNVKKTDDEPKNTKSILGKVAGMLNIKNAYLDSERSFAKFRILDNNSLLSFNNDNTFVVISTFGRYYKATYDPKNGGECYKMEEKDILRNEK